ncbi:hypothetical protein PSACC_01791 [Paramicrosporidium saccamoebae]|uniref:GOLD domain-containing protein n=1 Tax=Paramicrosporidium saccamoebae TaxID=1246581 RepID=A0A2H9TKW5_9FUNG|nr:hypothetical protein PSACC_01791 [Paramicrosporidium saccamoebae]
MLVKRLLSAAVLLATANAKMEPQPYEVTELDKVHIRLEGIREKCLVEDLPEKTVLLVKHSATSWNTGSSAKVETPFQLLVTVRDSSGHTVVRQQSKPNDRLFLTAANTGDHLVCFQAMLTQYSPSVIVKLGVEVFIGDAGDPHITSPMEASLNDLAFMISKTVDQTSDLQREQTLQRDREQHFRSKSDRVNGNVLKWAVLQIVILGIASVYQVYSLRRFFRSKKLV